MFFTLVIFVFAHLCLQRNTFLRDLKKGSSGGEKRVGWLVGGGQVDLFMLQRSPALENMHPIKHPPYVFRRKANGCRTAHAK